MGSAGTTKRYFRVGLGADKRLRPPTSPSPIMRLVTRITFLPGFAVTLLLAALLFTGPFSLSMEYPARVEVAPQVQRPTGEMHASRGAKSDGEGTTPPAFVAEAQKTVGAYPPPKSKAVTESKPDVAEPKKVEGDPQATEGESKQAAPESNIATEGKRTEGEAKASGSESKPTDAKPSSPDAKPATAPPTCKWSKYADWPYVPDSALSPLRKKLLYIKTPKSSSSTTAHILQRWTSRHGMVLGYPTFEGEDFTLETPDDIRLSVERAGVKHVDAFVSHMVYNATSIAAALGTDRPFRIASLREPNARSWSMFLHGMAMNISTFTRGASTPLDFASNIKHDSQFNYITGYNGNGVDDPAAASEHFDHFVLSHRVIESVVALAPKIGLRADDLLFFSQKTDMSKKTPADFVDEEGKKLVDTELRYKTLKDRAIFAIAERRLNKELEKLDGRVKEIIADVPLMKGEVKKVCGHIDLEDNSCAKGMRVWDGNAMCSAKCIQKWADKHIRCLK